MNEKRRFRLGELRMGPSLAFGKAASNCLSFTTLQWFIKNGWLLHYPGTRCEENLAAGYIICPECSLLLPGRAPHGPRGGGRIAAG